MVLDSAPCRPHVLLRSSKAERINAATGKGVNRPQVGRRKGTTCRTSFEARTAMRRARPKHPRMRTQDGREPTSPVARAPPEDYQTEL